jgi:serine/threonine-protein kinase
MPSTDETFLARLVSRGHLDEAPARAMLAELRTGAALDDLLVSRGGMDAAHVARLRRTDAFERPEIPGYEIGERLGVGGTAEVWAAREQKSGREVALKILSARLCRQKVPLEAFVREAKLMAQVRHERIVQGHGVLRIGPIYFAILERVRGRTLLERLEAEGPLAEDEALATMLKVASALEHLAMVHKLVHRDVKPGNIMQREDGSIVLIDLGFALPIGTDAAAAGTKEYVPPELLAGGAIDERSDMYSLGATLFHLAVGRLPFEGRDGDEALARALVEALRSPELKSRRFSPHLQFIVEKLLSKDPELRYSSWQELQQDVGELLAGRGAYDDVGRRPGDKRRR